MTNAEKKVQAKILICEDDPSINKLLAVTMEVADYGFQTVSCGRAALREILSNTPDVLLLDLGLPDMDGGEIIEKVRGFSQLPIIVVSARDDDSDKIKALDAGADDYLTKPFSTEELLARLRVSLRRTKLLTDLSVSKNIADRVIFKNGWLKIDYTAGTVFVNNQEIHLTPLEYKLLCLLAENQERVLTYNYIVKEVWGYYMDDLTVLRVFTTSLRKKIELNPSKPKLLQTHMGIGYRMAKIEE
jgi:two-component system KDP operon response regulator KdpE